MTERIPATYHQKEAKAMYVEEPEKQRANGPPILGGPFALCFSGIRSFSSGERRLRRSKPHIIRLCSDEDWLAGEAPANYRCPPVWESSPEQSTQSGAQLR